MENKNGNPVKQDNGRDEFGRFRPGVSGNPLGIGSNHERLMSLITDKIGEEAITFCVDTMRDPLINYTHRLTAATYLIDQKYGKAKQRLEHTGKDGDAIIFQQAAQSFDSRIAAILAAVESNGSGDIPKVSN